MCVELVPEALNTSFSPDSVHNRKPTGGVKQPKKMCRGSQCKLPRSSSVDFEKEAQTLYSTNGIRTQQPCVICYSTCLISNWQTHASYGSSQPPTIKDIFFSRYFKWACSCGVRFSVSTEVSMKCLCRRLNKKQTKQHKQDLYSAMVL